MNALRSTGALVVVAGLTVAACGGSDDDAGDEPTGDVQTLTITSRDDLRFDRTTLTATAGAVRFVHENDGNLDHTFLIDGADIRLVNDDSATIELAAGEYTFYCDVAGHRSAGMEGTLTVG
jgi:uncharacterized cupredoxin-like copper-binding protein